MFRWLLSTVGLAFVTGEVTAMAQRAARRGALFVSIVVLWLIAFGFAIAALSVWLATLVGVIWALAILAGVFALLGLTAQIAFMLSAQRPAQPVNPLAGLTGNPATGGSSVSLLGSLAVVAVLGWLLGRQTGDKK